MFLNFVCCDVSLSAGENWTQQLMKISNKISEGTKNPDQIARAVLRSQPPHAEDIPSMVNWSLKYSGGSSGFFTRELCHYCALKGVPNDLHIPGRFFEAMTKINFGIDTPARGMTAILKRIASSGQIVDSMPSDVKASDISAMGSKSDSKKVFLRASAIMDHCRVILDKKCIKDPQYTLYQGDVEIKLVDFVLGLTGKSKIDESIAKIEEIVKEWLHSLFGDDEDIGGPSTTLARSSAAPSNIVQYDDKGQAVDVAKMVIENKGVKVGSLFMHKRIEGDDRPTLYKLIEIKGDGTCVLHPMDDFGSEKTEAKVEVAGNVFLVEWRFCDKKYKFLADHKGTEVKHHIDFGDELITHNIKASMLLLAQSIHDYEVVHRMQPSKALFSKADYEVSKLLFVPFGSIVKYDPANNKSKTMQERTTIKIDMPDSSTSMYILHPQLSDDKNQNNYGAVRSTTIEEKSNMKIVNREVRFILPSISKLRISGNEYVVNVPCFQNYKAIHNNDELTYYVPKVKRDTDKKRDAPELKLDTAAIKKGKH